MDKAHPGSSATLRERLAGVASLRWRVEVWGQWLERGLAHRFAPALMLASVAAWYVYAYLKHPQRPREGMPGWWAWQDQSYYRSTAEAMAAFSAEPSQYKVSLGYPLLGLPFGNFDDQHLFFVPNLLMVLGIAAAFYRLGRLFLSRRDTVVMFLLVALWTEQELVISLVIPWTTIPTQLIAYAMIYLYLVRRPSWQLVLVLTALDGFAYLCRPGDAAFLSPLVAAAVIELPGAWRRKLAVAGVGLGLVVVFVVFDRVVNMAVFDKAVSSYERGVADDFFGFDMLQRAYGLVLDGMPVFRTAEPMLAERLPYLFWVGPGIAFAVRRLRWKALAPALCVVLGMLLYLSYDKFIPTSLYKFHLVHYVAWLFPLAGLAAYVSVRRAWERLRPLSFAALLGAPLCVLMFVRLEETPGPFVRVAPDGRLVPIAEQVSARARYDLLVGAPASGRLPWVVAGEAGTEVTSWGGAHLVHLAEPVRVSGLHAPHPADIGATLELRRLAWGLAPVPAWIDRAAGRSTVPAATLPVKATLGSWKGFQTDVGRRDDERKSLRSSGRAGMLQHGGELWLAHGRYVAEWMGVVEQGGRVIATVVDASTGETLGREVLELAPSEDPLLSAVEFRVRGGDARVAGWLYVMAGTELQMHRFQVWSWADWARLHSAPP